jgi:hypothetical protein
MRSLGAVPEQQVIQGRIPLMFLPSREISCTFLLYLIASASYPAKRPIETTTTQ